MFIMVTFYVQNLILKFQDQKNFFRGPPRLQSSDIDFLKENIAAV